MLSFGQLIPNLNGKAAAGRVKKNKVQGPLMKVRPRSFTSMLRRCLISGIFGGPFIDVISRTPYEKKTSRWALNFTNKWRHVVPTMRKYCQQKIAVTACKVQLWHKKWHRKCVNFSNVMLCLSICVVGFVVLMQFYQLAPLETKKLSQIIQPVFFFFLIGRWKDASHLLPTVNFL